MTIVVGHRPKLRPMSETDVAEEEIAPGDYLGVICDGKGTVWHFDGDEAYMLGVPNPTGIACVRATDLASLKENLRVLPMIAGRRFHVVRMKLPPGCYHPLIARPSNQTWEPGWGSFPDGIRIDQALVSTLNQLRSLIHMLDDIFRVVDPAVENMQCFGAGIRNLLMLACTECETLWRAVLTHNAYEFKGRASTQDFVKIKDALRLGEYAIQFQRWPWLSAAAPFRDWSETSPTKSIPWYDAYNSSKHDRYLNAKHATIDAAINSVAAVFIMIGASYGFQGVRHFDDINRFFHLSVAPRWPYSSCYTHSYGGVDAGPIPLAF